MAEMSEQAQPELSLAEALEAEFDKLQEEQPEQPATENELEATEETELPELEAEADDSEQPEEAPEVVPPEHWSDEDKTAFMNMDESGREWALRLEANAHKGIEEKSKELKKFRDAFEPYKHLVPPGGEAEAIQQLLNAQAVLQRNPQEGIEWLKRSYGIEQTPTAPVEDDEFMDPQVKQLKEQITELKSSAEQNLRNAETQKQQAMYAEIAQFRDAVNDEGEAAHPYFQKVQGAMAGLLQSGAAKDMDDAYAQAVWAVPDFREAEVNRIAQEKAEKELAEKSKAAKKAEAASKSVQGKKSAKTTTVPKTISDSLFDNYEKSIRGEL